MKMSKLPDWLYWSIFYAFAFFVAFPAHMAVLAIPAVSKELRFHVGIFWSDVIMIRDSERRKRSTRN